MIRIAISITTHNRYDVFKTTYDNVKKLMPKNSTLFVVDDGSDIPVKEATFRFETAQGIAVAKNKCFELAEGYDYHFALDDDIYPTKKNWHLKYIETGLNHLCLSFDKFSNGRPNGRRVINKKDGIVYYHEPCGLMLFYTKKCFDTVGGMDPDFGKWSYEHVQHSMRIHNSGLTPYPFMDIENSLDYFYSYDWDQTTTRSVDAAIRAKLSRKNEIKYRSEIKSAKYIPYKQKTGIILTSYFTGVIDPQRGEKWQFKEDDLLPLVKSANEQSSKIVVITDIIQFRERNNLEIDNSNLSFDCDPGYKDLNPYFRRWFSYRLFLLENPCDNVWIVDATDVKMLKNPFQIIEPSILYCGWEREFIGCAWMQNNHKSNFIQNFIKSNIRTPLLNAGVVGGSYEVVIEFLNRLCDMYDILPDMELNKTDMPLFNWVIYSHFLGRFKTGPTITTEFKKYDLNNQTALFAHK